MYGTHPMQGCPFLSQLWSPTQLMHQSIHERNILEASYAMLLFPLIIFITKHYLSTFPFPFPFLSMLGSCSIATSLASLH